MDESQWVGLIGDVARGFDRRLAVAGTEHNGCGLISAPVLELDGLVLVLAFAANRLILVGLLAVSFPSITFFIFYFFSVLLVVFVWRVEFAVLAGLDAGAFGTILRSRADASHRGKFMAFTGLLGFANGVGRNVDPFGDDLSGDLQAVEDEAGGFGADALGDERIEGLGDGGADGGVVLGDGMTKSSRQLMREVERFLVR